MARRKTKIHYLVFFIIIFIAAVVLLWFKFKLKNLSFEYQTLVSIRSQIQEEHNKLKIEYALINSPINIEKMAVERLNLKRPSEKQFRYIK